MGLHFGGVVWHLANFGLASNDFVEIVESWDESIKELQTKYEINSQLTEQIFDSRYLELFEKIVEKTKVGFAHHLHPRFLLIVGVCHPIQDGLNNIL